MRYLEQGTGKQLHDPTNGTGKYGQVISENAESIDNYTVVAPASQTLNIRIETGDVAVLNVITFYYTENEATINYQVVGPTGCGTVDLNDTDASTVPGTNVSETLKAVSGTAVGATAAANTPTYKFVGWYTDANCTNPVLTTDGTVNATNQFIPTKADDAVWPEKSTYYAKFEYNLTTLTITKKIEGTVEDDACFVFEVTGGDLTNPLYVTINGNGSVKIEGLKVDSTYTVSEVYGNWRYTSQTSSQEKKLDADSTKNTVTFRNKHSTNTWLDDNAYNENTFDGVSGN